MAKDELSIPGTLVKKSNSIIRTRITVKSVEASRILAHLVACIRTDDEKLQQAYSVAAKDIIPYIGGEEEKSEREPLKLWGHIEGDRIVNAEKPTITAQCFRVPVSDGHTAAVFVSFDKKPTKDQMLEAWANFRGPAQELNLPSAPKQFLHYFTEPDRPQPKLDRNTENGMAVCIGRLREDTLFDYKFACMSHNTLRGAAGGAVLLAELLAAKGYFD